MRLVIGIAYIIVACPSVFTQPTLYHSLYPPFMAFEEAPVMKEPEILLILVHLFPIAFGFFGDPKELFFCTRKYYVRISNTKSTRFSQPYQDIQ